MSIEVPFRFPVTNLERKLLKTIGKTASTSGPCKDFVCSGSLQLQQPDKAHILYFTSEDMSESRILRLGNALSDVESFHDACLPQSDSCRYMDSTMFGLNFQPLEHDSSIIPMITKITMKSITVKLEGIVSCRTGSEACIQPGYINPGAIGTLLIILNTDYEGAGITLSASAKKKHFDLSSASKTYKSDRIQWIYYNSSVKFSSTPITQGHLLALVYNVFSLQPIKCISRSAYSLPIYHTLEKCLKTRGFLPDGGRLAFPLTHEYLCQQAKWSRVFKLSLKGYDAAIAAVLEGLDLQYEPMAVYETDVSRWRDDEDEEFEDEDEDMERNSDKGSQTGEPEDLNLSTKILAMDEFDSMDKKKNALWLDDNYGRHPTQTAFQCLHYQGAKVDRTLIWINRPHGTTHAHNWTIRGHNGWLVRRDLYVSCALIVEFPAWGSPARAV